MAITHITPWTVEDLLSARYDADTSLPILKKDLDFLRSRKSQNAPVKIHLLTPWAKEDFLRLILSFSPGTSRHRLTILSSMTGAICWFGYLNRLI
jgi:hypothetical protein